MANRLSAPLTEDVARKARRAKGSPSDYHPTTFRSRHSDFVAREQASGRRARGDRQEFEPEHHGIPSGDVARSRYEDASGISSSLYSGGPAFSAPRALL